MDIIIDNGFFEEDTVFENVNNGLKIRVGNNIFQFYEDEFISDSGSLVIYCDNITVKPRCSNCVILSRNKK